MPSQPQRLAYAIVRGRGSELDVTWFPEQGPHTTVGPDLSGSPSWSPDGAGLAVEADNHIAVIELPVYRRVDLAPTGRSDRWPVFSPEGARIAYICDGGLCVMQTDGSQRHRLAETGSANSPPQWSPDGAKIAFIAQSSGNAFDLYVVNADGSNKVQLTTDAYGADHAAWSPSGRWIVFDTVAFDETNPPEELRAIRPDGSGQKTLAKGSIGDVFNWSFDGSRLAFNGGIDSLGNRAIHIVNVDPGTIETFATDGFDAAPAFSPDGRFIVYAGTCGGQDGVCAMELATRVVSTIASSWAGGRPVFAPR